MHAYVHYCSLFTLAKIWKLPRYPSIDDWIKVWYVYTM